MDNSISAKVYEEIGKNYRFFLGWRHLTLAGYIPILGATIKFITTNDDHLPRAIALLLCGVLAFLFWAFDFRTRQLYNAATASGKQFESENGINGFYSLIHTDKRDNDKRDNYKVKGLIQFIESAIKPKYQLDISHSNLIDKFFFISFIVSTTMAVCFIHTWNNFETFNSILISFIKSYLRIVN